MGGGAVAPCPHSHHGPLIGPPFGFGLCTNVMEKHAVCPSPDKCLAPLYPPPHAAVMLILCFPPLPISVASLLHLALFCCTEALQCNQAFLAQYVVLKIT